MFETQIPGSVARSLVEREPTRATVILVVKLISCMGRAYSMSTDRRVLQQRTWCNMSLAWCNATTACDITLRFQFVHAHRRLALETPVVTICTTRFKIQKNSTFCPHSVFVCFVCISEQKVIISLYSINWLVFINETERVYCAVRTGSLNNTQVILIIRGDATAQPKNFPKSNSILEIGERRTEKYFHFLGAFAKLRKEAISVVMSVCPSSRINSVPLDGFS